MFLDLVPLAAGIAFTFLFFVGYYVLKEELSLFLRDMANTSRTWPEVIGAGDAALDAAAVFGLSELLRLLLEGMGIKIPISILLGDLPISTILSVATFGFSFFGRRLKYGLFVKAFETKSRLDDLLVSTLMLLKSIGVGFLAYYFVGLISRLA